MSQLISFIRDRKRKEFEILEHLLHIPLFISDYLIKKEKPIQDEWDKLKAERKARLAKEWADYSDRTLDTFSYYAK